MPGKIVPNTQNALGRGGAPPKRGSPLDKQAQIRQTLRAQQAQAVAGLFGVPKRLGPVGPLGATGPTSDPGPDKANSKRVRLAQLPARIRWYNRFIAVLDCIIEKKELTIDQLQLVPSFVTTLEALVDFGGKKHALEGFKNSFWRCIHRVDSLIFQDYEFMKQLRQMLCEARQMRRPEVGKTWEEIAEEELAAGNDQLGFKAYEHLPGVMTTRAAKKLGL